MHPDFWHERWKGGQIGFHLPHPNPHLTRWWPTLHAHRGTTTLVPLCGKSQDLAWLAEQGHPVVGVELSPLAVVAFFTERGVVPEVAEAGAFRSLSAEGITLLHGDFFELPESTCYDVVYDRASIIALPPAMREQYADKLTRLVAPGGQVLLVSMDFPQEARPGPPHAVTAEEIQTLYAASFDIHLLETIDLRTTEAERFGMLAYATEQVWRLKKKLAA